MRIQHNEMEIEQFSDSAILTLTEVWRNYDNIRKHTNYSKLYKIYIVSKLNDQKVDFLIVLRGPDGSLQLLQRQGGWSIKKEDCPLSLVGKLEQTKENDLMVEGCPCTVVDSKGLSDYIKKMNRSRNKNQILKWIWNWRK